MTEADRRLCALAAALAPRGAAEWLRRAPARDGPALAAGLSALPRAARLAALAAASPGWGGPAAARAPERPRVAAVLADVAAGRAAASTASPVLLRLCRERLAAEGEARSP